MGNILDTVKALFTWLATIDSTLWGVFLGALVSLSTVWLNNRYSFSREAEQWKRQQAEKERERALEKEQRQEEVRKENREQLREIYHNLIQSLSVFSSGVRGDQQDEAYQNARKWLARLAVYRSGVLDPSDETIGIHAYAFLSMGGGSNASMLQDRIIDLVNTERELFPDTPVVLHKENQKRVQVNVDDDFRQRVFSEAGTEVRSTHIVSYTIEDLSSNQRKKLWEIYSTHSGIPEQIYLTLPHYDKASNKVLLKNGPGWKAKLNPLTSTTKVIFSAWEADYDEAYKVAEKMLAAS